jgi:hypothetical protein
MDVTLSYINGHVEVFDEAGRFLFSADNHREAMDEIELALQAQRAREMQVGLALAAAAAKTQAA